LSCKIREEREERRVSYKVGVREEGQRDRGIGFVNSEAEVRER